MFVLGFTFFTMPATEATYLHTHTNFITNVDLCIKTKSVTICKTIAITTKILRLFSHEFAIYCINIKKNMSTKYQQYIGYSCKAKSVLQVSNNSSKFKRLLKLKIRLSTLFTYKRKS